MKETLILCALKNGKHSTWVFTELKIETVPTDRRYISIVRGTHHEAYVDVTYIKGYNFKSWCEAYIKLYYGENVEQFRTIVRSTI